MTKGRVEALIAYHEHILATTRSGDRRLRAERAIARLRRGLTKLSHWTRERPRSRRTIVQAACGVFVRDRDLAQGQPPTCPACLAQFTEFDHLRIE